MNYHGWWFALMVHWEWRSQWHKCSGQTQGGRTAVVALALSCGSWLLWMSQPGTREIWQSSAVSEEFCWCYRITESLRLEKTSKSPSCAWSHLVTHIVPHPGVLGTCPGVAKAEWHQPRTARTWSHSLEWPSELQCSDTAPQFPICSFIALLSLAFIFT